MDRVADIVLFVWVAAISALLVVTGRRMSRRELPPNHTTGIRVPRTLENPDVWYAVHEKAGSRFVATGLGGAVVYVTAWAFLGTGVGINVWGGVVVAGVAATAIWSLRTTP